MITKFINFKKKLPQRFTYLLHSDQLTYTHFSDPTITIYSLPVMAMLSYFWALILFYQSQMSNIRCFICFSHHLQNHDSVYRSCVSIWERRMVMLPLQKAEFANCSLPNTPADLHHRIKCHQQDLCNSQHLATFTTQNPISVDEISEVYWMIW